MFLNNKVLQSILNKFKLSNNLQSLQDDQEAGKKIKANKMTLV